MLNLKKILLLVDFPDTSLRVIHQAVALSRHFHAEIVMLHVATRVSHAAGVPTAGSEHAGWNMVAEVIREARKNKDELLEPELAGLTIRSLLLEGEATHAILQTAQQEKVNLIMMSSYGHAFDHFLVGSLTPKMVHGSECPVWTDAHVEPATPQKFAIRNILCAVDFKAHSHKSALWAAQMAAEFGLHLTLAHVTAGVEFWGPGGYYVNQEWKTALIANASQQMSELLRATGIKADVLIDSGDVPAMLSHAAQQTKADLLITGCQPYGGYLRTHGYSIIRAMRIPVLSV